jgi:hypothetical protein
VKAKLTAVVAAAAVAAVATPLLIAGPATATATASQRTTAPAFGAPTFVHVPADQAAHPSAHYRVVVHHRPPLLPRARVPSPTTGQRYAGRWTVEIPSLKTTLTVTATPTLQEIQANSPFAPGINEAASTVTGVYQGEPVIGKAYVEQLGIWK